MRPNVYVDHEVSRFVCLFLVDLTSEEEISTAFFILSDRLNNFQRHFFSKPLSSSFLRNISKVKKSSRVSDYALKCLILSFHPWANLCFENFDWQVLKLYRKAKQCKKHWFNITPFLPTWNVVTILSIFFFKILHNLNANHRNLPYDKITHMKSDSTL